MKLHTVPPPATHDLFAMLFHGKKWIAGGLALLLTLSACALSPEPAAEESGYLIYYLARSDESQGGDLIQGSWEQLALAEDAGLTEQARAVVERLIAGPAEDESLRSPLPGDISLLSLDMQDRRITVDLSGGFAQLSGIELTLVDYCLTLSLTALEGISAVSITAQGREVGQQPKQIFYERDVLLSDMGDVLQTVKVTLYFLNGQGALEGEERTLEVYEGQTLAENLVAALLSGPESRELTRVIPEDFMVNSVRVDEGICYVNISAASLASLPEDEAAQRLILWSLADSLYSLEAVEELRLLSDGQELTHFGLVPVSTVAVRPQG